MDKGAEAREPRVLLQREARHQDFEGDLRTDVSKLSIVEIEADGPLRAILHPLEPEKSSLRVDESADEPRRGDPIDPQMLACRPRAAPVASGASTMGRVCGRPRFIG